MARADGDRIDEVNMFRAFLIPIAISVTMASFGSGNARAAGALAVGTCGAYGTAYGFDHMLGARRAALDHCTGTGCSVAVTIRNQCAAFAIERHRSCGARGWSHAATRAEAEEIAMQYCESYGRHRCKVRAWVCDDRG